MVRIASFIAGGFDVDVSGIVQAEVLINPSADRRSAVNGAPLRPAVDQGRDGFVERGCLLGHEVQRLVETALERTFGRLVVVLQGAFGSYLDDQEIGLRREARILETARHDSAAGA